ncbi:MAG: hypothetical protein KZQ97_09805 [Candidatus Thiodiazotropha sp. (ex Dulcina madagascariensis)]|nr:hypothetical protein [Candidatus Thiodiazotropha sp. (ex Dulcina madagascariensis)]
MGKKEGMVAQASQDPAFDDLHPDLSLSLVFWFMGLFCLDAFGCLTGNSLYLFFVHLAYLLFWGNDKQIHNLIYSLLFKIVLTISA